jgi:hypothetical protein
MANNTGLKFGGREAGTPNKLTKELRGALEKVLQKEFELLPKHFAKLEPKDRLEIFVKLLPYILPKVEPEAEQSTFEGVRLISGLTPPIGE